MWDKVLFIIYIVEVARARFKLKFKSCAREIIVKYSIKNVKLK